MTIAAAKDHSLRNFLLLMGAVGVGGVLIAAALDANDTRSPAEKIAAACDKEFGGQTSASSNCQVRLMSEALLKARSGAIDRARSAAGQ